MPEEQWTKVARLSDLRNGVPVAARAGKAKVLLVLLDGRTYACGDECTHYGGPLSQGLLVRRAVTCPWHNARFDVRTGRMVAPPALKGVTCYPTKVEGGDVFVGAARKPDAPAVAEDDGRTFVIIGAGAAGNMAAETLRDEGFGGRILLITGEPDPPYDRPALSKDFMAGEVTTKSLPLRNARFYESRRIELLTERRVTALDPGERTVSFGDGTRVRFDAALLATGGTPRRPDMPGADLPGVFLLRSLRDAEAIVEAAGKAGTAVVIGAGFIGMEAASSLRARGLDVHLVAPGAVPMASVFGEQIGRWLQRLHEENGVRFHLENSVKAVTGNGKVQGVELSDGSRVAADLVVAGIGITPAIGYLQGTGLVENGAVPVNGRLQTSAESVFAAGDIAVVPDPHGGELQRVEHWVVAERQGQHAARAMLGSAEAYSEVPFFWTMQFGTLVKYAGFARQHDAFAVRGSVDGGDFLAGYYGGGRLKAVSAAGRAQEFIAASEVIRAGGTISAEQLRDQGTDLRGLLTR